MRTAVRSTLFTLALSAVLAAPLLAAADYFEGWDTPADEAGWIPNTISCEVQQFAASGNPGGYLASFQIDGTFNTIGATTELADASGNYAAAGVIQVSFDLRNEFVDVRDVRFRVRYQGPANNGWSFFLTNDLPLGTWVPFIINFDPTWTDAEAILAGWASDGPGTPDFATTMSDVYHPEVRIDIAPPTAPVLNGVNHVGLDNFRIVTSCDGETTPPEVDITLSRDVLWPPNHKMVEVCVEDFGITDNCDPNPTVELVSVTSDEPDNGTGDGDTEGDIEILEDNCFLLRAERAGNGDGRKYTITYDVTDAEGNTTTAMACVTVPHSQGGHAMASSGFAPQGATFLSYMSNYVVVIPSRGGVDARTIDPERALVGNHLGVVSPVDYYRLDVNGDRREDLALVYSISPTQELIDLTEAENRAGVESGLDPASPGDLLLVKPNAVGLLYESNGSTYYVNDVTKLGSPVKLPPKEGEHGDGGTAEIPRDGLDLGAGLMTVSQGGRVTVEVFNIQGQKVRTILDQDVTSGTVSIAWDGRDDSGSTTPGGIYFTRIVAPGVQQTRKVFISNR